MIRTLTGLALLALAGCASAPNPATLSDDEIRYRMIREVTVAYGGSCDKQNASAKSDAKYRFCSVEDISQQAVDAYRLGLASASTDFESNGDPFSP